MLCLHILDARQGLQIIIASFSWMIHELCSLFHHTPAAKPLCPP